MKDIHMTIDNEGDSYPYLNNCLGGTSYGGANIIVFIGEYDYSIKIFNELDKMIDNSNGPGCGKIRINEDIDHVYFNLSPN